MQGGVLGTLTGNLVKLCFAVSDYFAVVTFYLLVVDFADQAALFDFKFQVSHFSNV